MVHKAKDKRSYKSIEESVRFRRRKSSLNKSIDFTKVARVTQPEKLEFLLKKDIILFTVEKFSFVLYVLTEHARAQRTPNRKNLLYREEFYATGANLIVSLYPGLCTDII